MSTSWMDLPADHPFGLTALPYGVFSTDDPDLRRVGVRIGDHVLDAGAAAEHAGMESGDLLDPARASTTSCRAARTPGPPPARGSSRCSPTPPTATRVEPHLLPLADVTMHLPFEVADYVDFYASEQHATNVGRIFRPDGEALTPNWKHLPIGYHGRAGTVVVSAAPTSSGPTGQRKAPADAAPVFGPSVRLDIEAELGFVVGGATAIGTRVGVDEADDHLFGVVLLNDWSARDIQAWEYVPLGPFLGKSFGTSISAWVAADGGPARGPRRRCPARTPSRCPTCAARRRATYGLDVHCEVRLNGTARLDARTTREMYWSPAQMLAHLSVNGASLRDGDLFGSGTISGTDAGTRGSLLELTWNGRSR